MVLIPLSVVRLAAIGVYVPLSAKSVNTTDLHRMYLPITINVEPMELSGLLRAGLEVKVLAQVAE